VVVTTMTVMLITEHSMTDITSGRLKKVKGLDTCYSAAYTSQTQEQQHFTVSEVAADWHELMIPQHIMRLSSARANGQLDPRCS